VNASPAAAPAADSIALERLRELWVHTGTACNLSCPFCHEGSKPADTRIEAPTLAQLVPLLELAAARGVERFAFTGGEPLILKGILDILLHAAAIRPVLVLTNGTAPFIRRAHQLTLLRQASHPVAFRVSIDHPDEAVHDAGRGYRNFRKAIEGLKLLHAAGFEVGITRQITPGEDAAQIVEKFRLVLRRNHLPPDLPIVPLPQLGALGEAAPLAAPAGTGCAAEAGAVQPPCARSRMLLSKGGHMRVHACMLTDDAPRFDLGASLDAALAARVIPDHPRCAICRGAGVDYAGTR
jgi:pyruvate-formate lyase-activating enzyme